MALLSAKEIERELKRKNRGVTLPKQIDFSYATESKELTMTFRTLQCCGLKAEDDGYNMQSDSGAFESWAVALYVNLMGAEGTILLEAPPDGELPGAPYTNRRHYGRFLYRAMRFEEQYPWFRLSAKLSDAVSSFRAYLGEHTFFNNAAKKEAADKGKLESWIEGVWIEKGAPLLRRMLQQQGLPAENCEFFRQLPVGLFEERVDRSAAVFTGGSSAIDLWTICGDTFVPIELKTLSRMAGALTELFFYSNYAYDMFVRQSNSFQMCIPKKMFRGYRQLCSPQTPLRRVQGFLLLDSDSEHPLISEETVHALNTGATQISYGLLKYRWKCEVEERS